MNRVNAEPGMVALKLEALRKPMTTPDGRTYLAFDGHATMAAILEKGGSLATQHEVARIGATHRTQDKSGVNHEKLLRKIQAVRTFINDSC